MQPPGRSEPSRFVSFLGRSTAAVAVLLAMLGASDCQRRKPLPSSGKKGPPVTIVERAPPRSTATPSTAQWVEERESNDDLEHAQPLELGKGVRGSIGPSRLVGSKTVADQDFYSWVEQGASSVSDAATADLIHEGRFELTTSPGLDVTLTLFDGDGKRLVVVNDGGEGESEVLANVAIRPGRVYFVRVGLSATAKNTAALPASYELAWSTKEAVPGAESEPNDDAAHATVLSAVPSAGGALAVGSRIAASGFYGRRHDEDWLALPPVARGTTPAGLVLRLEVGAVEGVTTEVRVFRDSGVLLTSARSRRGGELRLRNVGLGADAHPLVMLKAAQGKNTIARWFLRGELEEPIANAELEPNDTLPQATPVPFSADTAEVSGFLWPGDSDVYRVDVAPGALVSAELGGIPDVDLKLERLADAVRREASVLVRADDTGVGEGEALPPWPVLSGRAFFRVSARPNDTSVDVPYRLVFTQAIDGEGTLEHEPNGSANTATPWKEGASAMRGYLAPRGDEDLFQFVAPADKTTARGQISGGGTMGASARFLSSGLLPLGTPGTSQGTAFSAPIAPGQRYFVQVKALSGRVPSAHDPYSVTLTFE